MTSTPRQGIYKKWTLTDAELAEIQQLARICQEHEPLDLRLNWEIKPTSNYTTAMIS